MLLWFLDKNEGKLVKYKEFDSLEEAVEIANSLSYDFFKITSEEHNRVLNGFRILGELIWRLESNHRSLTLKKY